MDHQIRLGIKPELDKSALGQVTRETQKLIKDTLDATQRSVKMGGFSDLTKGITQVTSLSAKMGLQLSNVNKAWVTEIRNGLNAELNTTIKKYDEIAGQIKENIRLQNEAAKAGRSAEIQRLEIQKSTLMEDLSSVQNRVENASRMESQLPQFGGGGMSRARKIGFGVGVGAMAVGQLAQFSANNITKPYEYQAQAMQPLIQRRLAAFEGDLSSFFLEAKYGALTKAQKEAEKAAPRQLFGGIIGRMGQAISQDALQGGLIAGKIGAGAGAVVGAVQGAFGGAGDLYDYYGRGGKQAAIANLREKIFQEQKIASINQRFFEIGQGQADQMYNLEAGTGLSTKALQQGFYGNSNLSPSFQKAILGNYAGALGTAGAQNVNTALSGVRAAGFAPEKYVQSAAAYQMYGAPAGTSFERQANIASALGFNQDSAQSLLGAASQASVKATGSGAGQTSYFNAIAAGAIGSGLGANEAGVNAATQSLNQISSDAQASPINSYNTTRVAAKYGKSNDAVTFLIKKAI
jgi:hypothetical protein